MTRDDDAHDQSDARLLEELAKLRAAGVAEPRQNVAKTRPSFSAPLPASALPRPNLPHLRP